MNSSRQEATVSDLLIHLDTAYTFARWVLVDPMEAEDAVLEASRQAIRCDAHFRNAGLFACFLTLVRNACHARLRCNGSKPGQAGIDIEAAGSAVPRAVVHRDERTATLSNALLHLPLELREVIVLREVHKLPYKAISTITGVPSNTIMSRLSRARMMLMESVFPDAGQAAPSASCPVGDEI
jgi:RNA polymerase sigma factor (sigma-70 family)